ncbi:hypothetical protein ACFWIQ_25260 [Kitasatospora sp. NPDC127059]|uniref:hypothetical protein n=1 Tax=unclassified Kitasatospora TaxID=2633591 RepID=UPI0036507D6F
MTVTGRIEGVPSEVWHQEVLAPQFAYEAEHLLRHYVQIERVLLLEYRRMGLLDGAGTAAIAARLDEVSPDTVRANPRENMSDISFALERHVTAGPVPPFAAWHADRSRNDLQVCAQLLSAREQVRALAADLLAFDAAVRTLAELAVDQERLTERWARRTAAATAADRVAALLAADRERSEGSEWSERSERSGRSERSEGS